MSPARTDAGFTLVEALVALGVFAMAGVGLVQLQTHSLRTLVGVETRALAETLAHNILVETVAADAAPALGAREIEQQFAGRAWQVTVTVAGTPDPSARRISVLAREVGGSAPAVQTHAFMATSHEAPP
ncbi:MAG TPA: type II secretion system minor pseudopilin GspI [Terricaulis sp.]|nr:type II secretion system minor pseudopilin GspI [Terricaulis sp.]